MATRGGSNEFHGEGYFQATADFFNATEGGYYQRSAANAAVAQFLRPQKDDYRIFYPGFRVGGPILKNSLFFSAAYSPELEKTTRVIPYTTGARTFEQTQTRHYGLARLDYQPFQKLQLNSSWTWTPFSQTGNLPNRDFQLAPPSNDLSIQGGYRPSQSYSISSTYAATSNLVLSARFGYRYFNDKLNNYGLAGDPFLIYRASATQFPELPPNIRQSNNYRNVSSTFGIVKDITTRQNVYLDATYVIGRHSLKGGYQINRLSNEVFDDFTNGQFDIHWGERFSRGSIRDAAGPYGYYIWQDGVRHTGNVNSRNQGLFIQDTWRVNPRLTINAGVRFENEFLPPFQSEFNGVKIANPISFDWGSKIAPRLGAAWDVMGDGKWKVAGSFGIFYDSLKYELARGSFGSDYWVSHVYELTNPNVFALSKTNPGASGRKVTEYNNREIAVNERGEIAGVDPDIKPYTSREFTVNLEHQLAPRLVAGLRYSHKDLLKAIEDIGVLDAEDNEVYLIGNPGFGQTRSDPTKTYDQKTPNGRNFLVPEAKRQYDAVEFRLQGQYNRATFIGSYTWSRLFGNYSGAANSDESGRSDPGVSRAFDLPYYYFDATGSQENVNGLLGTDRPHTFKFFGSYNLNSKLGNTNFGFNQIAYSGTPDTTTIIYLSAPTTPFGRGDLGRTPFLTQSDLFVRHAIRTTERTRIEVEANAVNVLNQGAVISRTTQLNRSGAVSGLNPDAAGFFAGYNPRTFITPNGGGGTAAINPIYGLPGASYRNGIEAVDTTQSSAYFATFPGFGAYQQGRVLRLGLRFVF
ncbi:MAG: hypothetical protein WKF37_07525 [Bryobacteraceae bacterium]